MDRWDETDYRLMKTPNTEEEKDGQQYWRRLYSLFGFTRSAPFSLQGIITLSFERRGDM